MSLRVFITGGSSYLGRHMVPFMLQKGHEVCHTWHSTPPAADFGGQAMQADMRNASQVSACADAFRPDVIIHLAASNRSPDEESMVSSIEEGAKNIANAAQKHNCRLIHMSTDVIFDGSEIIYTEKSDFSPPHAYGRAKANAETIVSQYSNTAIIRPSLIYSLEIKDRSTEWMESSIKEGKPVTLFTDQLRKPVWTGTLCEACLELASNQFKGVVHVVGNQVISRADFGLRLMEWWGIDHNGLVKTAPTPADAPWPMNLQLDITLATQVLKTELLGVDQVFSKHGHIG